MTLIDSDKLISALILDKKIITMLLNNSDESNKFLLSCKDLVPSQDVNLNPAELEQTSILISSVYDNVIKKIHMLSMTETGEHKQNKELQK